MQTVTQNYIVTHTNGKKTEVTSIASIRQVFAFVEFRDEDGELVIAINRDNMSFYAPVTMARVVKPKPRYNTSK